jgi:hypothetical protein
MTVSVSGSNLFTDSAYRIEAEVDGVIGSGIPTISTSQVSITFDQGLPATDAPTAVTLTYIDDTTGNRFTALNTGAEVQEVLAVSFSTPGLTCSYGGGCEYFITGSGVAGSLLLADNHVKVCGRECTLDETASNGSGAACVLPALPTSYSVANF